MTYRGADGADHRPYMVHRALLGSLERFFGVLIEHYGGAFPLWLAPVQARLIPIADRHMDYAQEALARLKAAGLRVELDDSNGRMNAKIRDAQLQKVPTCWWWATARPRLALRCACANGTWAPCRSRALSSGCRRWWPRAQRNL